MKPPKRHKSIWEALDWMAHDTQTPMCELIFPPAGGEWDEWDRELSQLSHDDLLTLAIGEVSEAQAIADRSRALRRFRLWLEAVFQLTDGEGGDDAKD